MLQKSLHSAIARNLKRAIIDKLPLNIGGIHKGDNPQIHHAIATTALRKTWEYKVPMVLATADISRAFATIPHSLILEGLRDLQVEESLICLIGWVLRTATIEINMPTRDAFSIVLQRGVVEGSPLSMLLLAVASYKLLKYLNDDAHFAAAMMTLPTALESCELLIPPHLWVDDWLLCAPSRDSMQTQLTRLQALLNRHGMEIKTDKIHWIANDQIMEQQIFFGGQAIDKENTLVYMGLKLDAKGSINTHVEFRRSQANAVWARTWQSTSFARTPRAIKIRLYTSTFLKSLTWGIGSFPDMTSTLTGMSTKALKPLRCLYGKKASETVEHWWRRAHNQLRRDRYAGEIRHPMHEVVNQWRLLGSFVKEHPQHTLAKLLSWRGTAWLKLGLTRYQRPMRRQGQVPQLLESIAAEINGKEHRMLKVVKRYLEADCKPDPSFHSSSPPSPPLSQAF